ncbi:MAG: isocitrate/isopropylmalate dehydrogenase family protein [Rhodoglobus sp.]|nr:isocitrate/isopropylmalate dehydrogenase family protein [Rhodoglobus sp.]
MINPLRIAVMEGDAIGPEIVPAALRVAEAAASQAGAGSFEWVHLPMGAASVAEGGRAVPVDNFPVLDSCTGWVVGPHDSQAYGKEWREGPEKVPGAQLRVQYDLYANIRPARTRPAVPSRWSDVDVVTVRENTEGLYSDRNMYAGEGEFMPDPDTAISMGLFTRARIRRIAIAAFELARARRSHLTIVHKSNVMPRSFGLWLAECREVASLYPDVKVDDYLFDSMAALLVRRPETFDVILTENLTGDVLSDLVGEMVGGLGCSASLNAGVAHAMAQAAHGSAPDIAGKDIANPIGMIESTAMLMRWLGQNQSSEPLVNTADLMERAIAQTLDSGIRTTDLGGSSGTREITDAIVNTISRG